VLIINKQALLSEAIIEHHTYICVMKWMRKEKIVDAGWSVHFVMTGIIWTAAGALECPYSNLEEFDFYI